MMEGPLESKTSVSTPSYHHVSFFLQLKISTTSIDISAFIDSDFDGCFIDLCLAEEDGITTETLKTLKTVNDVDRRPLGTATPKTKLCP